MYSAQCRRYGLRFIWYFFFAIFLRFFFFFSFIQFFFAFPLNFFPIIGNEIGVNSQGAMDETRKRSSSEGHFSTANKRKSHRKNSISLNGLNRSQSFESNGSLCEDVNDVDSSSGDVEVSTPFVTNTNNSSGKNFSIDHSHIINELNKSSHSNDNDDSILHRKNVSATTVTYDVTSPSSSHNKHDNAIDNEIDKEEDEMSLKRKRSKSFSELLLPQFKEIIPITSYREMGLSLSDNEAAPSSSSGVLSGTYVYCYLFMLIVYMFTCAYLHIYINIYYVSLSSFLSLYIYIHRYIYICVYVYIR
jgi:hypothetical protein